MHLYTQTNRIFTADQKFEYGLYFLQKKQLIIHKRKLYSSRLFEIDKKP